MADKTGKPSKGPQAREDRLKAALKANMAKRKSQARARTETASAAPQNAEQQQKEKE